MQERGSAERGGQPPPRVSPRAVWRREGGSETNPTARRGERQGPAPESGWLARTLAR